MILHIIQDEKFTFPFVSFLFRNFTGHKVCIYRCRDKDKYASLQANLIILTNDELRDLQFAEYEAIFIHGFQNKCILDLLCKKFFLLKKVMLIMWGADLYNNKLFLMEHKGIFLGRRLTELKKRLIISHVSGFMTFACSDYNQAKKWYGAKGHTMDCLYPSTVDFKSLLEAKQNKTKQNNATRILVGNSAALTNNHIEAFELLSKYKNDNIEVFVPLSYNIKKEYLDKVIKKGNEIFAEKFKPITDFMTPSAYTVFLSSIDIAVFNHNRQQATGVIEILGFLGSKIFIRSDTTTWNHYVQRDKCPFYDTLSIKNLSFLQLKEYKQNEIKFSESYFSKIWDENYLISIWKKAFNKMTSTSIGFDK